MTDKFILTCLTGSVLNEKDLREITEKLVSEVRQLRSDSERLDWLETIIRRPEYGVFTMDYIQWSIRVAVGQSIRRVIDRARGVK